MINTHIHIYPYVYIHTHGLLLLSHKREILPPPTTWMDLDVIMPSDMSHAAAAKPLHSCPTLCDPIEQPTRLRCPWDSPGKNTGVGCHFLLQCLKVKSESEVAQCPTLHDPMDCSLPGSCIHGIFQARVLIFHIGKGKNCMLPHI